MDHVVHETLEALPTPLSVCRVPDFSGLTPNAALCFTARTDEECSLVCDTRFVPDNASAREDGWQAFRIRGVLDFSLIGVLARIASLLADAGISIFAVSTYNTDYILTKEPDRALRVLAEAGYRIIQPEAGAFGEQKFTPSTEE